ncbi:glycosyltransferase [Herbiconiux solani]|uniref:glycosyltransferase n=1 Tax=Herbiconiux solani TaxID=661329 RepID=UPI0009FC57C4|nr:glycosyltransferase [Herbiconiux solani]
MKILQVATLVTPDGAYGGPVRVALNQLRALQELGHEVTLAAGTRGFEEVPTVVDGVPVRLFEVKKTVPGTGFAGLSSPGLRKFVRSNLDAFDVVHIHLARDLVTLPIARRVSKSQVPLVVQPHGMIDESSNPLAPLIDAFYTRKVLRTSARVLALTDKEAKSLRNVSRSSLRLDRITNGVRMPGLTARPTSTEVLFLARLHPRKRAAQFVEMARDLSAEGDASFALVGPDEGEGPLVEAKIRQYGLSPRVRWEGPISPDATLSRMAKASVYVLPSVGEVVPMSLLEAMSLGLPCVITKSNGLAEELSRSGAALVTDGSLEGLTTAVRSLLADQNLRSEIGERARKVVDESFSIGAVAAQLELFYGAATARSQSRVPPK